MAYIVAVKRTQLYLAEEEARLLAAESRRRGTTVSALVRDAVRRSYGRDEGDDRSAIIDRLAGAWGDRRQIGSSDDLVRQLRRSNRAARWAGGGGGKVPARHRRDH